MTRAELQRLIEAAVRRGEITAAQQAEILAAYDAGTLDVDAIAASSPETAALVALAQLRKKPARRGGGGYTYDVGRRRYIAPTVPAPVRERPDPALPRPPELRPGRVMTPREVRQALDYALDRGEREMVRATESLRDGRINLAEWQRRMERMIAVRGLGSAVIGLGGNERLSAADKRRISGEIAEQLKFLRQFADDIKTGRQPLNGRAIARTKQYAQASRGIFEAERGQAARVGGNNEERRELHGTDHCRVSKRLGCFETAARGWVPIGTLPRIGACTCLHNCRCTFRYRRAA